MIKMFKMLFVTIISIFLLTVPAFAQSGWEDGVKAMHDVWYLSNTQSVLPPAKVIPGWRMANTNGFTIQIPQNWSEYGDGFHEPWCAAPPEQNMEIGIFVDLHLVPGLSMDEMTDGLLSDLFGLENCPIIYKDSVVNPFIASGFGQTGLSSFTAFKFNYNGEEAVGVLAYTILADGYGYSSIAGHYFLGLGHSFTNTTVNVFGPMASTLWIPQGSSGESYGEYDRDRDGVPDSNDNYPDDPGRW